LVEPTGLVLVTVLLVAALLAPAATALPTQANKSPVVSKTQR